MSNEERRRLMEFILEHQAQFAASIQRHDENFQRLEEERIRDRPRLAELEKSFQQLVRLEQIVDSRLDRLELTTAAQEAKSVSFEDSVQRLTRLVENTRAKLARLEST